MPHPVLLLRGEHGTAKSSAARLLTSLIDRSASQLRTAPRNVEDWAVAAAGSWVTCLDNVSDIQHWLQDAICRAVTGDGLLRRQLYTDSDVSRAGVPPGRRTDQHRSRPAQRRPGRPAAHRRAGTDPESARGAEEELTEKWAAIHAGCSAGCCTPR